MFETILHVEDITHFEYLGLLSSPHGRFRKVSTSTIKLLSITSTPTDNDLGYSSESSGASSMIDLPEMLDSVETLQFLGLDGSTASNVFNLWRSSDLPDDLLKAAVGFIHSCPQDAVGDSEI